MSVAVVYGESGAGPVDSTGGWAQWVRLPLEMWGARRRFVIASMIAIAVFTAGANAWRAADVGGVQARRALLDEDRRHLQDAGQAIRQLPALRRAAAEPPTARDAAKWTSADDLRVVSQLATASGVELLALEPQSVTGTGLSAVRPMHLTARGSFAAVVKFLHGLSNLPVLAVPTDLSIRRRAGTLAISARLDMFDALRPSTAHPDGDVDMQPDDDVLFDDPFSPPEQRAASENLLLRLVGLLRDDRHGLALLETPDGIATVARGEGVGNERVIRIDPLGVTLATPNGTHALTLAEVTP
ncbi:MAG: hypothetical protein JO371_05350 [Paraburkholderia sp.]|nr:hypothetical protein [Paraburkholderia sp.]